MKRPEFAKVARISESHLTNIELGHKRPSPEVTWRLCNALGITPDDLQPAA